MTQGKVLLVSTACAVLLLAGAKANAKSSENLEQQIDTTFAIMIKDPSNIDITLEYVNLVIDAKDYEAAIPPLERILFFNPELDDIKLRLGVMYYNLKSYGMAEEYFKAAKSHTKDKEIADQADIYLSRM
jgi:tetratricopeptide (TPR) repeat protein